MNPATIIALLNAASVLLPELLKAANEIKTTSGATDQAAIDAAVANLSTTALPHLTQAETDLDKAAAQ